MTEKAAPKRPDSCHELAVKMLDELRSCICEIYVDEGFNGPIYHYSFEEKAVQVAEKFLRTAEENQDDGRAVQGNQKCIGDNRVPAGRDCGTSNRSDSEVAPPLTEAPQPVPTDSHAQGTTPATNKHKDADTPEELTSWIWCKFVGVPAAGPGWEQEREELLDRVRRMDRSSFTKGLHEGANQMKALKAQPSAPSVSEPQKENQ